MINNIYVLGKFDNSLYSIYGGNKDIAIKNGKYEVTNLIFFNKKEAYLYIDTNFSEKNRDKYFIIEV